jgi:hypothetical protein
MKEKSSGSACESAVATIAEGKIMMCYDIVNVSRRPRRESTLSSVSAHKKLIVSLGTRGVASGNHGGQA